MMPAPKACFPRLSRLIWALIGCYGLHHAGLAQEFEMLWSQPPGYLVFTNAPEMHGTGRSSTIDWESLTDSTNPAPWNTIVADDFRGSGQPVAHIRWWGSYRTGSEPLSTNDLFEDAFVLSFFGSSGGSNQHLPGRPLAIYLAPVAAVHAASTPYSDADGRRIYQYETALRDTLLDHGVSAVARPYAFLPSSNGLYWLSVAAEAGLRLRQETNQSSLITNWLRDYTGKRATNSFWRWQSAPEQHDGTSVSDGVAKLGSNWVSRRNNGGPMKHLTGNLTKALNLLAAAVQTARTSGRSRRNVVSR